MPRARAASALGGQSLSLRTMAAIVTAVMSLLRTRWFISGPSDRRWRTARPAVRRLRFALGLLSRTAMAKAIASSGFVRLHTSVSVTADPPIATPSEGSQITAMATCASGSRWTLPQAPIECVGACPQGTTIPSTTVCCRLQAWTGVGVRAREITARVLSTAAEDASSGTDPKAFSTPPNCPAFSASVLAGQQTTCAKSAQSELAGEITATTTLLTTTRYTRQHMDWPTARRVAPLQESALGWSLHLKAGAAKCGCGPAGQRNPSLDMSAGRGCKCGHLEGSLGNFVLFRAIRPAF
mmetsp:Transcript_41516/g.96596  ORF Transcript_41516/g.96596 Transcript_41516/m.96596 type:complete len:296 (-) Transcript_41516:29-916(-)